MRVFPALQVRDARLRHRIGAAHLDAVHQVEPLHRHFGDGPEVDGGGIVDADVDAAELFHRLGNGGADGVRVADVPDDRQCLTAGFLELFGCRVYGARKLRVGFGGLGDQCDVRTVLCGPLGDRQADTAAGAGDEHGLAVKGHGVTLTPPWISEDCGIADRSGNSGRENAVD